MKLKIIFSLAALLVAGCVNSTSTPAPTRKPSAPTTTPVTQVVSNPTPSCLKWNQVTAEMEGKTVCVYGVVTDHVENFEAQQTFFYFGGRDKFFFTTLGHWDFTEDSCISTTGKIQLNTYKTPYIKIDQLTDCSERSLNSPENNPTAEIITLPPIVFTPSPISSDSRYDAYSMTAQADLTQWAQDDEIFRLEISETLTAAAYGGSSNQPGVCNIKGNISFDGEKIFHVPGQEFYNATVIDTSYGERWFCSEDEARAAGWRKSNR